MAFDPSNVFGTTSHSDNAATQQKEYDFTEIMTYNIVSGPNLSDLEDTSTEAAGEWQAHLATYAACAGAGAVWWGYDKSKGHSNEVVLVVDWTSASERKAFYASQQASPFPLGNSQSETQAAGAVTKKSRQLFKLADYFPSRHNAFLPAKKSCASECVSVFVTFQLSSSCDLSSIHDTAQQRSKRDIWDDIWDVFAHTALQSNGGCISSGRIEGWAVYDPDASNDGHGSEKFLGVFRFRDLESARKFFDLEVEGAWKECVEQFRAVDDGLRIDVRFIEMREELIGEK